jgi:hypothetical protein
MELIEAYELVMSKVNALRQSGIQISLTPPQSINDEKLVADVKAKDGLPVDKWMRISFQNLSEEQTKAVFDSGNYLGRMGILFDCGGSPKLRDWEIDWSLRFNKSGAKEWLDARALNELNIDNMNTEKAN